MSNPPPVKTTLSPPAVGASPAEKAPAPAPAAAAVAPAEAPSQARASAPDPETEPVSDPVVAAVMRILRPIPEPKVHVQADALLPTATRVEVSLALHQLRVLREGEVLVESPVATGRDVSPTPPGTFSLAAKPPVPSALRYGHYRTRAGVLLVRGVFPKIDPLPVDAVFDQIVPKGFMQLSDDGPVLFGGEATGAATTDGALVLPDRIALLLHEKLPLGVPFFIEA